MEAALNELLKLVKSILSFHKDVSSDIELIKKFMDKLKEKVTSIEQIVSSVSSEEYDDISEDEKPKKKDKK